MYVCVWGVTRWFVAATLSCFLVRLLWQFEMTVPNEYNKYLPQTTTEHLCYKAHMVHGSQVVHFYVHIYIQLSNHSFILSFRIQTLIEFQLLMGTRSGPNID